MHSATPWKRRLSAEQGAVGFARNQAVMSVTRSYIHGCPAQSTRRHTHSATHTHTWRGDDVVQAPLHLINVLLYCFWHNRALPSRLHQGAAHVWGEVGGG